MASTIFDLQEERAGIFEQQKAILDKASTEGRDLTAEERGQCDKMDNDIDTLGDQIKAKEGDEARRKRNADRASEFSRPRNAGRRADPTDTPKGSDDAAAFKDIYSELKNSIALGSSRKEALQGIIKTYNSSLELDLVRQAARRFIEVGPGNMTMKEKAALQADVDASGGTLVMPEDFVARLIIGLDERVFMRQISTILPLTNAESVGIPSLETDPSDADWTSELSIGSEDTAMTTGKRTLTPHPLAKFIKVSKTLLRKSVIPAESLVRDRLEFKFAVSEEKGYLTGSGGNQPLGVFTASNYGIDTSRDISTGNTSTTIEADGLINCKYNLMSQYLANTGNLRWIFHRTAIRDIRKLKDGNGQYLWVMGLGGQPDKILEIQYEMSEFAPSTFTSGSYVGILGDFKYYWIAESLRFELQRLDELYAGANQVGFIGRLETDGMPVLAEAFSRVKLA